MSPTTPTPQPDRVRHALYLDRSGGANPADAAGADINQIIAVYRKTGTLPNVALSNPLYGDFTFPDDIHSMREAVSQAEDRFDRLPSSVRSLCDNDWVQFLDRFNDPEGRASLEAAGLQIGDVPPTPEVLPPTPPADPVPATDAPAPTPPPTPPAE